MFSGWGSSSTSGMDKILFQLKFTAKQLQNQSKKASRDEVAEKEKCKKALQKGNTEAARLHASSSIRKKSESLHLLRLASRVDAVASRVETAVAMGRLTSSMARVVRGMEAASKTMDLEKIARVMEGFEEQFENLDVQTASMEGALASQNAIMSPGDEVDELMMRVADENGLEMQMEMPGVGVGVGVEGTKVSARADPAQEELEQRLAKLRNS
ncbi:Snf7-domain-containing protein [Zopfochytrium polystomum]|nr:Snf7-domain-containing protein [Zopfochytrium polystomum]